MRWNKIYWGMVVLTLAGIGGGTVVLRKQEGLCLRFKENMNSLQQLMQEYELLNQEVSEIEKKMSTQFQSVTAVINEYAARLGIAARIQAISIIGEDQFHDIKSETVEVTFSGLDSNQLVNVLYVVERGEYPLLIREVSLLSGFENKNLIKLKLVLTGLRKT